MGSTDAHEGGGMSSSQANEFVPGASQPTVETNETNETEEGFFTAPPSKSGPSSSGVAPKSWQKNQKTVTTRAEVLRARSSREKKINKKYVD